MDDAPAAAPPPEGVPVPPTPLPVQPLSPPPLIAASTSCSVCCQQQRYNPLPSTSSGTVEDVEDGSEDGVGGGSGEKGTAGGFNRNFLRCLVLLLPVAVPVVVYVRDVDATRRVFLFAFVLFLVLVFSCVTLAVVRSRSKSGNDEEDPAPSTRALSFPRLHRPHYLDRAVPYWTVGQHVHYQPAAQLSPSSCRTGGHRVTPILLDDPPSYLDALKCPLANTRALETPPPSYEAVS
ncbi:uncharacterized protein LOC135385887 [Ornithodoros turicata]|uniref:uncharacterized protein LOC135385887 n=1 Tax=Ornithodoros turicata TaxID=34597 RepID=UPI0031397009